MRNDIKDPGEECDGDDAEACGDMHAKKIAPAKRNHGTCEPKTQGFWKRVCDGVYGFLRRIIQRHLADFSDSLLCADLQARGNRNLPCVRSASQIAALKLNSKYGKLDDSCKVYYDGDEMTAGDVLSKIDAINAEDCKDAADLAEAINSRDAL